MVQNFENITDDIIFENEEYIVTLKDNIVYDYQQVIMNKTKSKELKKIINNVIGKQMIILKYRIMSRLINVMLQYKNSLTIDNKI